MSGDRTVIRPTKPRYSINEIVYSKISAKKGFIEPFKVANIEFVPSKSQFEYSFFRDAKLGSNRFKGKSIEFLPITLLEEELLTLCEALDIHIEVISRDLAAMRTKLEENCISSDGEEKPEIATPIRNNNLITPPEPRFGIREVVYLKETAQAVGRLEAMRIDNLKWDKSVNEWLYIFQIRPRPRRNTTVGDREDLRRGSVVAYPESQLCLICEALPVAVNFLEIALQRSQFKRESLCGS